MVVIIAILLPLTIGIIVCCWLFLFSIERKHKKYIFKQENSVRSLVIDKNNKIVRFFNRNKLKDIRTVTLEEFYIQFSTQDAHRLDTWLNELCKKNSKVDDFFEVEVFMNKNRKKYFTLLKACNVDKEKKIIHIDSYLFLHLSTRTKTGYRLTDLPIEDAINQLKLKPTIKGSTINFKFTFINKNSTTTLVDKLLFTQLKEITLTYAYPPNRHLIETGTSEFTILDLKNSDIKVITSFVHKVVNAYKKFLEINAESSNVAIAVGIVGNKYFPNNAMNLINKAQEMANFAREKNVLMVSYDKAGMSNEEKHESEVELIIRERKLKYSFQGVYDVRKEKIIGYLSYSTPYNTSAKTIDELYLRSVKNEETAKLLEAITKDITIIFSALASNRNLLLFRTLKFKDCIPFINLTKGSASKSLKYVTCFEEYDISYYLAHNNDFFTTVEKMKDKGIQTCLKLSDKSCILDNKVYASFDYFIVNIKQDSIKDDGKESNIEYRVICEKLLKYRKPIIISNIEGWDVIELLVRSGIEYISSPTICQRGETLNEPTAKSMQKIRRMLN